MTELFKLQAVDVRYGRVQALSGCTLRIQAGERLALVGSNGSGKSTLLRTLNGLVKPAAGSLQHDTRACQAMLFQRPYMLRASVLRNVALGLLLLAVVLLLNVLIALVRRWRERLDDDPPPERVKLLAAQPQGGGE